MQSAIEISQQTHKIFHWNGILDPHGLGEIYTKTIEQLIHGDYAGLDFEKLVGHDVFSVRINHSDRLLFNKVIVNSKPYLMLLDVVLNHDYAKSRFLKPDVLKNYMELHGQAISVDIVEKHFKTHQMPIKKTRQNRTSKAVDYSRIDFYNQKFIELDITQLNTATKTTLPLIISGAAGSGKSCIALLILAQYIESNYLNEFPILYVTESENLANSMQRVWSSLPIAQNLEPNAVQFKSYQQLIIDQADDDNLIFVSKDHCVNWLMDYIKIYKKIRPTIKNETVSDQFLEDLDTIYQEFRIMSGCASYDAYNDLGSKQALFANTAEGKWLFNTFTAYENHLKSKNAVHAPFYPLAVKDKFKRIVVDEAQDFSHRQLEILANLAEGKQICFCEDNRQSLQDNKSKIPFLKNLIHSWDLDANIVPLDASYRCLENIIKIVNVLSGLKAVATGHGQEDITCPENQTNKGNVSWFAELSDEEFATLQGEASSPDFAIITSNEHKEDAKKLFKTDLVFTVDEIKGLEYKKVMAWRLFDEPLFKEANAYIGQQSADIIKKSGNRAKKDQGNEQFGPPFSAVYTAFTRATDTLYIYQPKCHSLENITTKLIDSINKEQAPILAENPVSTEVNINDWFAQVKLQLNMGNEDIAKGIYVNTLHKAPEEFETFKTSFLKPAHHPVSNNNTNTNTKRPEPAISTTVTTNNTSKSKTTNPLPKKNQPKTPQVSLQKKDEPQTVIKEPEEITKLFNNPSESNFFNFLKRKNIVTLLFKTQLKNGGCLFSDLIECSDTRKTFFNCIKMSQKKIQSTIAKGITKEALCRPETKHQHSSLFWLFLEGMEILKILMNENPAILMLITGEALSLPVIAERLAHFSPLYFLSTSIDGVKLLTGLLLKNPELKHTLQPEAFCRTRPKHVELHRNVSPLLLLSKPEEGQIVLDLLFQNPKFAMGITAEAFNLTLDASIGEDCNTSPLYWLSSKVTGITSLKTLFSNNPELANSVSLKTLCLRLTHAKWHYANTSALYWLTYTSERIKILDRLLANITIDAEILGTALCINTFADTGKDSKTTPLYFLSKSSEGLTLLQKLLKKEPKLAEYITAEALCLARPQAAGKQANMSALYMLSMTEPGQIILQILVDSNPELAKSISLEALHLIPDSSMNDQVGIAPIDFLWNTFRGRSILNILGKDNPGLLKIIQETSFESSSTKKLGMFSQTNSTPVDTRHPEAELLDTMIDITL